MADIDYGAWLNFALLAGGDLKPKRILELFAGHAPLEKIATKQGHEVLALDLEPKILAQAQGRRVAADALQIPVGDGIFDLALATNASINYLPDMAVLTRHFVEVKRVLKSEGNYVFDCCTPGRAATLHLRSMQSEAAGVVFSHMYDSAGGYLLTQVNVNGRGSEEHRQRIFSEAEIRHAANLSGFAIAQTVPNYGLPVIPGSEPIVTWVMRRP